MLTMAIMAMGTLSAFAQNTLTKEYDFGKITKIEASSIFDIEVTQGLVVVNYFYFLRK